MAPTDLGAVASASLFSHPRQMSPLLGELGIGGGDSRNSDFYEILMVQDFLLTTF
jgi:hypothetical protein